VTVGVEVGVRVAVAVGVLVGVPGLVQQAEPSSSVTPSTRQPGLLTLSSVPIRQRRTTLWPAAAAGSSTAVVRYPPEFPVHADRPPSGLLNAEERVPL
jgi:hypothetical protein